MNKVSIKDFGGVGNGIADDTFAMSSMIDYCSVTGDTAYIPAGTYRCRPTIRIFTGINLVGDNFRFDLNEISRAMKGIRYVY